MIFNVFLFSLKGYSATLSKGFDENYKETELALNFIQKQYFS